MIDGTTSRRVWMVEQEVDLEERVHPLIWLKTCGTPEEAEAYRTREGARRPGARLWISGPWTDVGAGLTRCADTAHW